MSDNADQAATPPPTGGRGRGWRAGRGQGRRPGRTTTSTTSSFKGTVNEMNGHVFQCYGEATEKNQFARTMEELDTYVGLHFKHHPSDIKKMMKNMKDTTIEQPDDYAKDSKLTVVRIWEKEVDMYVKRRETYSSNKCALYSLVWGQCSEAMQAKIKSAEDYEDVQENSDSLLLLKEIKGIAYKFESQKNIYLALDNAKTAFYSYRQPSGETNASYLSKFKNGIEVIEHYGGNIGDDKALVIEELKKAVRPTENASESQMESATKAAKSKAHAMAFLKRADKERYGQLLTDLENQYTRGNDQYPNSVTEAYNLMVNYKKPTNGRERTPRHQRAEREPAAIQDEMAFVQQRGGAPPPLETVQCYNCQEMGHYANDCTAQRVPRRQGSGVQLLQYDDDPTEDDNDVQFSFHLTGGEVTLKKAHMINQDWILLDSESTVCIFSNGKFLRNIRPCENTQGMRVYSNGGHQDTHLVGDLPGFGPVWYNEGSLANILSLAAVRKVCRVTMDSREEAAMIVHKHNGKQMKFTESHAGLYYHDTNASKKASNNYVLLNSVEQNKSLYTRRQIQQADLAKRVYALVGRPSQATFMKMIRENQLKHCPIIMDDAMRAVQIYGPNLNALRGKTTRRAIDHVPSNQSTPVPQEILSAHRRVTLCFDIFFVDGHAFVGTVSRGLRFLTVEHIPTRHIMKHVYPCLTRVRNLYSARGFRIVMMHADDEFTSLRDPLLALDGIGLNIAATNEHVPEIERAIRTIKERNRAAVSALPFKHYPKLFKIAMVMQAVTWLNMLPHTDGASATVSPRTLVTGVSADFTTQCRVPIGAYCEVHNENNPSNTETPRTSEAIALNPTGNLQGSYHFLSLATGKRITRRRWTELPTPAAVIARIHELALNEPHYDPTAPAFAYNWTPGHPLGHATECQATAAQPPVLVGAETLETVEEITAIAEEGVDETNEEEEEETIAEEGVDETNEEEEETKEDDTVGNNMPDAQGAPVEEADAQEAPVEEETQNEGAQDEGAQDEGAQDEGAQDEGAQDEAPAEADAPYNLRGKAINYDHRYAHQFAQVAKETKPRAPPQTSANDLINHVLATGMLFNQMGAKAGVKRYGTKAVEAIVDEYKQLDNKGAFKPRRADSLSTQDRKQALRSITLIKEKRCGKIKGRTVADGRSQRQHIERDDATSPTVSTEALMISLAIDAKEGRAVATADVEGAYLHADMDELVIMMFEGEMVDYMIQANPERYAPFVHTHPNGKKVLYVELLKALYGCIKSALLWYKLFTSTLMKMGFKLNPYDPCVANKTINGHQCTICWYVDDLKISHKELSVVKEIISAVEERYGKMVVTYGDKHTYVGMNIEFTGNGEVQIRMPEYLTEAIEAFTEDCSKAVATPAAAHLFEIDNECVKLDESDRKNLHSIVAKLLFVAKRGRPDIQVPIAFLSSRVTIADKDDWKKLKRLLQYLNNTIDMPLTLSIDNLSIVKTWVDASYAIHHDMRSHTGGAIMMGKGTLYAKSSKQRINVKSSTEAELVGASDFYPQTVWTRNFIEAQGYKIEQSDYYQDNMSAMKMERNGRSSAGQRSRHINIRYFFIKDRIEQGEINLLHCPTGDMIADFFTKPLQGLVFQKFRDIIMGIEHFSILNAPLTNAPPSDDARSVLEIPVGIPEAS